MYPTNSHSHLAALLSREFAQIVALIYYELRSFYDRLSGTLADIN